MRVAGRLKNFLSLLESHGELVRVKEPVDPELEVTEIAVRALREDRPAILFENVKGSVYPLAVNMFASEKRIKLALGGTDPDELGESLIGFLERLIPPKPSQLLREHRWIRRILKSSPRLVPKKKSVSARLTLKADLSQLPVQKCWPEDGGRFITLGQVCTRCPTTGKRNMGIYRMQIFDSQSTGMHWQIQKGGGFHYFEACRKKEPLPVACVLGGSPATLLAAVAALPEGIDELLFAGFLQQEPVRLRPAESICLDVLADAEFVIEGLVPPNETRLEGPFGDHFGHYSAPAPFPVFHVQKITSAPDPVYPGTVVGIPPMEDRYLGDATQKILGPLIQLTFPEIREVWAYYEAGFHNLLVASVKQRYCKEPLKVAMGILGSGQLSLTKTLILVGADVNPRNFSEVLQQLRLHFDPATDFTLLSNVPLDTLDFTSFKMNLGSRMILDATPGQPAADNSSVDYSDLERVVREDQNILDWTVWEDTLGLVQVRGAGRPVLETLLPLASIQHLKVLAVVSDDVDIRDRENGIWGIFTRFDCARDVVFPERVLNGIQPVFRGTLGIDATWKKGYPLPLSMVEEIVEKVNKKWNRIWQKS